MKVTFPSLLLLTFIVLKLTKVIDWSWWWVTAPVWGTFVVVFIYVLISEIIKATESPEQKAARNLREMAKRLSRR